MPADQPQTTEEAAQGQGTPGPDDAVEAEGQDEETRRLEEESEVAADYLEELLDIADLDGDIEIEVRQNRTFLSVVTEQGHEEDLQMLVGRNGEVLDSLQELVRLSVLASTGNRSRLILDIAGHRERREEALKGMAQEAVDAVRSAGEAFHLKPLSPYERKLVHDFVAELGFHSESEGEGPRRHIVVTGRDPQDARDTASPATGTATSEGGAAETASGQGEAAAVVEPVFAAPRVEESTGDHTGNEGA